MSDSIGKVQLDLETNYAPFQQQLNNISGKSTNMVKSAFAGLGKVFAGVFAVTKLVQFGKASIDLASDLAEVQNVVDVVFGESSAQINNFAKNALTSYGLSELSAKQYASTMGAMLKSMGLSNDAVLGMSQSITALTGDMASFYNLDSDTAFQKIRAGISGETEPLKQLGINMSVANMEAFALEQGITKSYQKMSQSEQALLRYNYLLKTTADAQGDFARTSDSWANQTRILSEQFNALKATLGSAFISLLTPVVRMLNMVISKLQIAAAYFKAFVEALTGVKSESSDVSSGISDLGDSITEAGDATVAAANKASNSLAGFDKLNVLSSNSDSGGSSGSSGGGGDFSIPSMDLGLSSADTSMDSMLGKLDEFKKKLEELAEWTGLDKLWKGIEQGVKKVDFKAIKTNFSDTFNSLLPIAKSAFDGIGTVSRSKMQFLGSLFEGLIATSGKSIEIAAGGVSKFLNSQQKTISKWIEDTSLSMSQGFNNLSFSAETIFSSFWEALDNNQLEVEEAINNLLTSCSDMSMTIGTIFTDLWVGLTQGLADFLSENQPLLDEFFDGLIESSTKVSDVITTSTDDIFKSIKGWWDNDGKRIWDEIVGVFFDIVGWVLEIWNEILKPVIDYLSGALDGLWNEHIQPLWEKFLKFITSLWDAIKSIWDFIKPFVSWIIDLVGPRIVGVLQKVIGIITTILGIVLDVIGGIIKALTGVLDFVTGVFTGDWEKAWNGIKTYFEGIWDAIWAVIKGVINFIIGGINSLWSGIYKVVKGIIDTIGKIAGVVGDLLGQNWEFSIPSQPPLIPKLAKGGIIDQPTLAMVGERGKEAVVPLEDTSFADSIANAILRVLAPFLSGNDKSGGSKDENQTIILRIGEYELGRVTVKAINKYHNAIGEVELEV